MSEVIAILFWLCLLFILYVYAGYPLLIWLLSRTKKKDLFPERIPDVDLPPVTLMICTYKEEAVIGRKLENSLALDYPREKLDILVVNDGDLDRTAEIVRAYAERGVRLSQSNERGGKTAAIARGMQQTTAEIVILSDANNDFEKNALYELVKYFRDPQVGMVSGARVLYDEERGLAYSEGSYWKYESFIKKCESRFHSCASSPGEINAVRRSLFPVPPQGIINDDAYITLGIVRQGYRVRYAPEACSYEYVSATAKDEIKRRKRINAGRYQIIGNSKELLPWKTDKTFVWEYFSHKIFRPLAAFALAGVLLMNILAFCFPPRGECSWLCLLRPLSGILLLLQLLFYLMAWVGSRLDLNKGVLKLLYIPTFFVNSNLAAISGYLGYRQKKQTTLWEKAERKAESETDRESHPSAFPK